MSKPREIFLSQGHKNDHDGSVICYASGTGPEDFRLDLNQIELGWEDIFLLQTFLEECVRAGFNTETAGTVMAGPETDVD